LSMSPKKTKHQDALSPTPKNPIPRRSSVSRRIIFWGLLTSLGLIAVACMLDYQQGKLADHTSRIPYELQKATHYVMSMASEMPHNLEIWSQEAKGQLVVLGGKFYIGDKTVAQLLFGVDDKPADNIPEDVKEDFEIQDKVEDLIDPLMEVMEEETLAALKANEELAIKLRKEEELRIYEEKRVKLKEEAKEKMEKEKQAAMDALIEEKAKFMAKIEAEAKLTKSKMEGNVDKDALKEAMPTEVSSPKPMVYQKPEMDKVAADLNKKMLKAVIQGETDGQVVMRDGIMKEQAIEDLEENEVEETKESLETDGSGIQRDDFVK